MMAVAAIMATMNAVAQTNLAGRVYYNPNVLSGELNKMMDGVNEKLDSVRAEAIAKAKKEKGRDLTAAEKAEVDKQVQQAHDTMIALKKGMKTSITVEFKTEKNAVMKLDMSVSEDVLKAAGIGWAKRKAMKAALALAPTTSKVTYEVKGNLVIMNDDGELDTLRLSTDGKQLYGILEQGSKDKKPTKFTLNRTK